MIPHYGWRDRLRLAWAILTEKVYIDGTGKFGWGQTITLRTVDDVTIVRGQR